MGLRDHGYVEGTTIVIEYRWAEGKYERLRELVTELIRSNVDVIVTHGTPGALAAKQATTAIPIVVTLLGDPVASGIVVSLARPEANITGQSFFSPELAAKRIELLKDLLPQMTPGRCAYEPRQSCCHRGGVTGMQTTPLEPAARLDAVEIAIQIDPIFSSAE